MRTLTPHHATVDDTLSHLVPSRPQCLISAAARTAVGRVARRRPAGLSGWHHLECRLDESNDVDLIVQVEARGPMSLLSHLCAPSPLGSVWHNVGRLANEWIGD